ncbi:MAG: lysophospholipid acyltransferase family protein [Sphingobacteriales bacterium]|nr:lysophospholipid acyltransferase family protein [Sphingobacteriales bacterium]
MEAIGYYAVRLLLSSFRFMPFPVLYALSGAVRVLLQHIIGYRSKVVTDNLRRCFPEKSEAELKNIARLSYLNLSDITLEAFKGYSMSEAVLQKRFKVLNAELPQQYLDTGRKVMLLGAHYGNWEWGGVSIPLSLKQMTVAVYKAMSNKRLEEYMFHQRAYRNLYLAPNSLTEPTFAKFANQAVMLALVADQNPSNADRAYWIDFVGQDTACIHGPEKYANLYDCVVMYGEVERVRRGYYEFKYVLLTETPRQLPEGELTRRYMGHLEQILRHKPPRLALDTPPLETSARVCKISRVNFL